MIRVVIGLAITGCGGKAAEPTTPEPIGGSDVGGSSVWSSSDLCAVLARVLPERDDGFASLRGGAAELTEEERDNPTFEGKWASLVELGNAVAVVDSNDNVATWTATIATADLQARFESTTRIVGECEALSGWPQGRAPLGSDRHYVLDGPDGETVSVWIEVPDAVVVELQVFVQ